MPVLEADFFTERTSGKNPLSSKPFGLMFEALDDLAPDEIYICAGGSHRYALWGGLMSTRALQCGAAGAVVHGFTATPRRFCAWVSRWRHLALTRKTRARAARL